jgi:hypothetical protein
VVTTAAGGGAMMGCCATVRGFGAAGTVAVWLASNIGANTQAAISATPSVDRITATREIREGRSVATSVVE